MFNSFFLIITHMTDFIDRFHFIIQKDINQLKWPSLSISNQIEGSWRAKNFQKSFQEIRVHETWKICNKEHFIGRFCSNLTTFFERPKFSILWFITRNTNFKDVFNFFHKSFTQIFGSLL